METPDTTFEILRLFAANPALENLRGALESLNGKTCCEQVKFPDRKRHGRKNEGRKISEKRTDREIT
jgi:hypothetical protein